MAWVVDTSVLLDIFAGDPKFARPSALCLIAHSEDGLMLAPVTYVELAPAFEGNTATQNQFLKQLGISWPQPWSLEDTLTAHRLWTIHVAEKRKGAAKKRPVADTLIEAFAARHQGIITRNPIDFKNVTVVTP